MAITPPEARVAANPRPSARLPATHPFPALALYALPLVVSALCLSPAATLVLVAVVAAARAALRFVALARPAPGYVLESISASHYVETVRWALDRLGTAYVEVESVGIVGALLFQRLVPTLHLPASRTRVSDSPAVLDYLYSRHLRDGGAGFLHPLVRTEDVDLEAKVLRLGVATRKWAYYHVIEGSQNTELLLRLWGVRQPNVPLWQVVFVHVMHPLLRLFIINRLKISEAEKDRALAYMEDVFSIVDARLADGRHYLLGDDIGFSRLDIQLATFIGVVLRPDEYGGGCLAPGSRVCFQDLPAGARGELEGLAARPVGQYCLRMFREERNRCPHRW